MADNNRLPWDPSEAENKNITHPQPPKPKKNPTARRDSKVMAKSPEILSEKDLVAFDHVAAGQYVQLG
jgi:hypothetical protein